MMTAIYSSRHRMEVVGDSCNLLERTSKDLVEEDLDMVDSERLLGYDDAMKVTLHQFSSHVAITRCQGHIR